MKRPALLVLAVGVVSSLSITAAQAQNAKDFSTVRFYPAVGPNNFIAVEGAHVGGHLRQSFGVMFDYSANTLVVNKPCDGVVNPLRCENEKTRFIAGTGMFHLMASVSLAERTQLSVDLPVGFVDSERFFTRVRTDDGSSPSRTFAPNQGFAFADMRLAAKTRILGEDSDPFALAATAFTTLPTGMITSSGNCNDKGSCSFTGERGVNIGANVVAEYRVANFRTAANLGAAYRPHRTYLTRETGSELLYGVAGQYDITPLIHVKAEVAGWVNLVGADDHPIEARGALSYGEDLVVMAGGGGGLYGEVGNPSYRVFAGLQWTPVVHDADQDRIDDERDGCPSEPEDRDGFADDDGCPEPDNDGDGVPDKIDACDNEREDMDGFADEDGCPELDNDGDGVQDGYDSCEGAKEDKDGDKDDDGCPDFDTDHDSINDDIDYCPNEREDTDGLADEDGCPEEDFDGDGLKDTDDGCSDQPETWNGILDEDGCPEDDTDGDTVPDQIDACEGQAETLNGVKDGDGCPDGVAVIQVTGQRIVPIGPIQFDDKDHLTIEKPLIATLADYIKRNHRRGPVRVTLTSPGSSLGAGRVEIIVRALAKRVQREVLGNHIVGTPSKLEIELVPPALKALPPPHHAAPVSPVAPTQAMPQPPASEQPPAPTREPAVSPRPTAPNPTAAPKPVAPKPPAAKPAAPQPAVAAPKPAEPKPAAAPKPVEAKPAAAPEPVQAKPSAAPQAVESKPAAAPVPAEPKPAAAPAPSGPKPAAAPKPVEPKPAAAPKPVEPKPAAAPKPVEPKPAAAPKPVEPKPAPAAPATP